MPRCPSSRRRSFPVATSLRRTTPSRGPAQANVRPSGDQATEKTVSTYLSETAATRPVSLPVAGFIRTTARYCPPRATSFASGEKAVPKEIIICPAHRGKPSVEVSRCWPVTTSQEWNRLGLLVGGRLESPRARSVRLSGLNANLAMSASGRSSLRNSFLVSVSICTIALSSPAHASSLPSGEIAACDA